MSDSFGYNDEIGGGSHKNHEVDCVSPGISTTKNVLLEKNGPNYTVVNGLKVYKNIKCESPCIKDKSVSLAPKGKKTMCNIAGLDLLESFNLIGQTLIRPCRKISSDDPDNPNPYSKPDIKASKFVKNATANNSKKISPAPVNYKKTLTFQDESPSKNLETNDTDQQAKIRRFIKMKIQCKEERAVSSPKKFKNGEIQKNIVDKTIKNNLLIKPTENDIYNNEFRYCKSFRRYNTNGESINLTSSPCKFGLNSNKYIIDDKLNRVHMNKRKSQSIHDSADGNHEISHFEKIRHKKYESHHELHQHELTEESDLGFEDKKDDEGYYQNENQNLSGDSNTNFNFEDSSYNIHQGLNSLCSNKHIQKTSGFKKLANQICIKKNQHYQTNIGSQYFSPKKSNFNGQYSLKKVADTSKTQRLQPDINSIASIGQGLDGIIDIQKINQVSHGSEYISLNQDDFGMEKNLNKNKIESFRGSDPGDFHTIFNINNNEERQNSVCSDSKKEEFDEVSSVSDFVNMDEQAEYLRAIEMQKSYLEKNELNDIAVINKGQWDRHSIKTRRNVIVNNILEENL